MAQPTIQTSFASGEWAPKLRSRVDIQKYKVGASLLRNFYVDWSGGGASTRQGTRFIAQTGAKGARLIPFQPSATITYVLEFGAGYIRFYSNGAQILSSGIPYQIPSPYAAADLFYNPGTGNPGLKYVQDVTSLIICHPNYAPQILTIISPTNWTLTAINFGQTIATPTGLAASSSLATSASSWSYAYTVTAVDANGQESVAATPATLLNYKSINDSTAPGTNTLTWSAVTGAVSYNVYKASPIFNTTFSTPTPVGFIGNTTSLSFTDTTPGFAPDFSQSPPIAENPFQGAGVQSYIVTNPDSYTTVPAVTVAAPPAGGSQATAQAQLGIISSSLGGLIGLGFSAGQIANVSNGPFTSTPVFATVQVDSVGGSGQILTYHVVWPGSITGAGAVTPPNPLFIVNPLNSANYAQFNATWGVTAVNSIQGGSGYTSVPSVTFSAGAAAATAVLATASAGNPGVPAFFQERLVFAAQQQSVQSFEMSQPGSFFNFDVSFPSQDDDAISGTIISEDLNNIKSLTQVPTGLLALTGKSAWLINGGSGVSTNNPVTPTSVTASPQSVHGASDLKPLRINQDILYVTNKGNYVRDLTYNIWSNIFAGADVTTLSNHLFFDFNLIDWCWAEDPFKTAWAVRDDGQLLSLGYVKDQELVGWAHHDTNGQFKSICAVLEVDADANTVDAVYVIVERTINGVVVQNVERMANRFFFYGAEDSWSVDCALQTAPQATHTTQLVITGNVSAVGNTVTLTDANGAPFTALMATNNWVVRADGGIYRITTFISALAVSATVVRVPPFFDTYTNTAFNVNDYYTIWQPVTSVSGLTQLLNTPVVGIADGNIVSGTVNSSGSLALGLTATKVTIGLAFTAQLQTLPLDLGEPTAQGKRKKITAMTVRAADTLGISAGTTFANVVPMKDFQLNNVPTTSTGVSVVTDLVNGDGRTIIDQAWQELGNYCVQQSQPYPATILGVMPEVIVGDTERSR